METNGSRGRRGGRAGPMPPNAAILSFRFGDFGRSRLQGPTAKPGCHTPFRQELTSIRGKILVQPAIVVNAALVTTHREAAATKCWTPSPALPSRVRRAPDAEAFGTRAAAAHVRGDLDYLGGTAHAATRPTALEPRPHAHRASPTRVNRTRAPGSSAYLGRRAASPCRRSRSSVRAKTPPLEVNSP